MRKGAVCVLLAGGAALIAVPARTASYYYDSSPRIITIEPVEEIEPPPPRPAPRRVVPPSPAPATSAQPLPQPRRAVREVIAPRPAPRDSAAAHAIERGMLDDEHAVAAPPPLPVPSSPPAPPQRYRTVLEPPPYAAGPTPLKPLSHRDSARSAPAAEAATAAAPALDEPAPAVR